MKADVSFIKDMIEGLMAISEPCEAGVQRRSYTEAYRRGADYVKKLMVSAGLIVREDLPGNVFGFLPGAGVENALPAIMSGSHLDTVCCAGGFDGVAGVACAIEAARMIQRSGKALDHPFVVFGTIEEEGTRFGQVTLGSKFMTGLFGDRELDILKECDSGKSLSEVLLEYRGYGDTLGREDRDVSFSSILDEISQGRVCGLVEVHGEQGPVLEEAECPIGLVDHIAGISWVRIRVHGMAGHSGTVPMDRRADAGIAAYRIILSVNDYVTEMYLNKATVTAGILNLEPGSSNCIPQTAEFTLDIRSGDRSILDSIIEKVKEITHSLSGNGIDIDLDILSDTDPTQLSPQIREMIEIAALKRGYRNMHLNSGAGHDSMIFARVWPTAMIFLPNRGGISHHPDEFIDWESLGRGAEILYDTIRQLDDSF